MISEETDRLQHGSLKLTNEIRHEPSRRAGSLHSYTRELLLSLQEKEECKRLPAGFDSSMLSEIGVAASHSLEWQPSRRNDYGSSSFSRVNNARWETRSSGSSEKDGNPLVDHDAFSQEYGRRGTNQQRRPGQKLEQDGLLGSGGFLRPSGYQGWNSASKDREDGQYQLKKSSEPYQPPRPFKSGPYSRRDNTDTFDDETFGSSEYSDQNRQEEERMRRESFELMRQEQKKTIQEKQKNVQRNHDESDISSLRNKRVVELLEKSDAHIVSKGDSLRPSLIGNVVGPRPLVPPGFSSAVAETSLCKQVSGFSLGSKADDTGINDGSPIVNDPEVVTREGSSLKKASDSGSLPFVGGLGSVSSGLRFSEPSIFTEHSSYNASAPFEFMEWGNIVTNDSNKKKTMIAEASDASGGAPSTSLLNKLFGDSLAEDGGTKAVEGTALDEAKWSTSQSSIFSSWFIEDTGKSREDSSSRDILSMIVTEEKGTHPNSSENAETSPRFSGGISDSYQGESPKVLTCEDLEQSILAEVEGGSCSQPLTTLNPDFDLPKADVDNHASEHLRTLLLKSKEVATIPARSNFQDDSETASDGPGKSLTLETLFGSAFMKELQSKDAPISGQKHSVDGTEISSKESSGEILRGISPDWINFDQSSRLPEEESLISLVGSSHLNAGHINERSSSSLSSFPGPRDLAWPETLPQHLRGLSPSPQLPYSQINHRIIPQQMGLPSRENSTALHHHNHLQHLMANATVPRQHPPHNPGDLRFDPRFRFQIPAPHIPVPLQYFPRAGPLPHSVNSMPHASLHDGMHAFQGHHPRTSFGMQIPGMAGVGPGHPLGRQIEIEIIQQQQQQQQRQHNSQPPSLFNPELSPDIS